MSEAAPTLVLITIDAEPSHKYESGCWSHCVNGRLPDRLEEWIERGIAERTDRGYRMLDHGSGRLSEVHGTDRAAGPVLSAQEVSARIASARAGLPSIFRTTERHGAPCVTFLDVSQLYAYGELLFREAVDLIMLSGNDLQLHLHPECLSAEWFAERGMMRPINAEAQDWPGDLLEHVHRIARDDLERMSGVRSTAYRAGAYRISDALIDALVRLGFEYDFSYDLLNRNGNVRFDPAKLRGNAPMRYRGLVEIPITAFGYRSPEKVRRFVANPNGFNRLEALKACRAAGLRVITYILHSYSLMRVYEDPERGIAKAGREGLDDRAIEHFDRELEFMRRSGEFQFVDVAGLSAAIAADPTILEGSDAFITVEKECARAGMQRL